MFIGSWELVIILAVLIICYAGYRVLKYLFRPKPPQ